MKTVEPIRDIKIIKNMRLVLKSQSTRNELLFVLGINVGLRISDIIKLKFSDLMMPNMKTVKDSVTITEKKTGKTKTFYIGDVVEKVLISYVKELNDITIDDYVFMSKKDKSKHIQRNRAYKIINNAAEMVGLVERDEKTGKLISGNTGTHSLRKSFGYFAYQNGTSIELLMQIFNHSSASQTLKYIGITEDEKKDVYLKSELG